MSETMEPGPCPYCTTPMVNAGAPIWEDYCPNESCTGHRDAMFAEMREKAKLARESSDELATLAAKYLGMTAGEASDMFGLMSVDPAWKMFEDIKRLAGSVVSQARGDK